MTLTGALGRVQRDHPVGFSVSVALVLLGAGLWLGSSLLKSKLSGLARVAGILLSLSGLVLAFVVTITSASDTEQPAVSLTISRDGSIATGTVNVSDLAPRERVALYVDGLTTGKNGYDPTSIYAAFLGPNSAGSISQSFRVAIPPAKYDAIAARAFKASTHPENCGAQAVLDFTRQPTGCVILQLPDQPPAPQLAASWEKGVTSGVVLDISLKASTARVSSDGNIGWFRSGGRGSPGESRSLPNDDIAAPWRIDPANDPHSGPSQAAPRVR